MSDSPQYFGDVFSVRTSPWGTSLTFGLSPTKEGVEEQEVCTVRMSHATAKTLSILLQKQIKALEKDIGRIRLPEQMIKGLGLTEEDWF